MNPSTLTFPGFCPGQAGNILQQMAKWICLKGPKDHESAVTTTIMIPWIRDSLAMNIMFLTELQRGESNKPEKTLRI